MSDAPDAPDAPDGTRPPLQHVTAAGRRVAYVDTGGPGPLVLALHGLPTSSLEWRGVLAALGDDVRVVAPDLPGFGASDPLPDQRLQAITAVVDAVVDEVLGDDLAAGRPVHLAAHDIGGVVGLSWAARHLVHVASITLLNTTTFWWQFVPPPPALLGVVAGAGAVERLLTRRLFVAGLQATYQREVPPGTAEAHWRPYELEEQRRSALARTLAGYRGVLPLLAEVNRALPSIQVPVNVLWGAGDPFCKLRSAVTFAKRLPSARLRVLADVGHFVPEEAPADVAHEIRGAIARAAAREGDPGS